MGVGMVGADASSELYAISDGHVSRSTIPSHHVLDNWRCAFRRFVGCRYLSGPCGDRVGGPTLFFHVMWVQRRVCILTQLQPGTQLAGGVCRSGDLASHKCAVALCMLSVPHISIHFVALCWKLITDSTCRLGPLLVQISFVVSLFKSEESGN